MKRKYNYLDLDDAITTIQNAEFIAKRNKKNANICYINNELVVLLDSEIKDEKIIETVRPILY